MRTSQEPVTRSRGGAGGCLWLGKEVDGGVGTWRGPWRRAHFTAGQTEACRGEFSPGLQGRWPVCALDGVPSSLSPRVREKNSDQGPRRDWEWHGHHNSSQIDSSHWTSSSSFSQNLQGERPCAGGDEAKREGKGCGSMHKVPTACSMQGRGALQVLMQVPRIMAQRSF